MFLRDEKEAGTPVSFILQVFFSQDKQIGAECQDRQKTDDPEQLQIRAAFCSERQRAGQIVRKIFAAADLEVCAGCAQQEEDGAETVKHHEQDGQDLSADDVDA